MASISLHDSGVFRIHSRYGTKQFYRALFTTDKKEALAAKTVVEETISLLKRGRFTLPADATYEDAANFILSGGKLAHKPTVSVPKSLAEVVAAYQADAPVGAKAAPTLRTEKIHIGHLLRLLKGSTPFGTIGPRELQSYVNKRAKEKVLHFLKSGITLHGQGHLALG